MSDTLKDFIECNRTAFKDFPPASLWPKIDNALQQNKNSIKSRKTLTVINYWFGISLAVAGTFLLLKLPDGKTNSSQAINQMLKDSSPKKLEAGNTAMDSMAVNKKNFMKTIDGRGKKEIIQKTYTLPETTELPTPPIEDRTDSPGVAAKDSIQVLTGSYRTRNVVSQNRRLDFGTCFNKANRKSIEGVMEKLLLRVSEETNCPNDQLTYSVLEYYTIFYSKECRHLPKRIVFDARGERWTYKHNGLSGAILYWILGSWVLETKLDNPETKSGDNGDKQ